MKTCNMCGSNNVVNLVDLGFQPLANSLLESRDDWYNRHELGLARCYDCGLIQLKNNLDPKNFYSEEPYPFYSGDMPGLANYFSEFVSNLSFTSSFVVDVGSNDGTLLSVFKEDGCVVLGVDPSKNVAIKAMSRGIPTIIDYFNSKVAELIYKEYGRKADVITAFNCVAHNNDLHEFIRSVNILLASYGVLVIEANYWGSMVEKTNYGMVYHEHYNFFTLEVWQKFLENYGMHVFDAEVTEAQSGSLRLYIGREDLHRKMSRLIELEEEERKSGINGSDVCVDFARRVIVSKETLDKVLSPIKDIAIYGVAAKGLTMLNYLNTPGEKFLYAVDDAPAKQGKFIPKGSIPIITWEEASRRGLPEYFLVLAYNFIDEIRKKVPSEVKLINALTGEII